MRKTWNLFEKKLYHVSWYPTKMRTANQWIRTKRVRISKTWWILWKIIVWTCRCWYAAFSPSFFSPSLSLALPFSLHFSTTRLSFIIIIYKVLLLKLKSDHKIKRRSPGLRNGIYQCNHLPSVIYHSNVNIYTYTRGIIHFYIYISIKRHIPKLFKLLHPYYSLFKLLSPLYTIFGNTPLCLQIVFTIESKVT